jgi:hypothetical protein
MRPRYKPQPVDIAWARQVLATVADGGTVVYPRTNMHYMVSHSPLTK